MHLEHVGDHLADPAEADDDGAGAFGRNLGIGWITAGTPFDPPRRHLSEPRQQRRDGEADRRDRLPETGGCGQDELGLSGRPQNDQRRFRRACHQYPGLRRDAGADAGEFEEPEGDRRLHREHARDAEQQCAPILRDGAQVKAHPDRDQENAEREALERGGHHLDFAVIIGFGDQHAGKQRADDRREPRRGGRQAGDDDDEQRGGEEQFRALGPGRLGKQAGQDEATADEHRGDGENAAADHADDRSQPSPDALGAKAASAKMIGTSARSSNNSIAKADLPTGLAVPAIGRTSAVEDRASARPRPIAPAQLCPIR